MKKDWTPIEGGSGNELERHFPEEEIKKTVFESDGSKAPDPNVFTLAFFQECWDIVKGDLVKVNEFFEGGC